MQYSLTFTGSGNATYQDIYLDEVNKIIIVDVVSNKHQYGDYKVTLSVSLADYPSVPAR